MASLYDVFQTLVPERKTTLTGSILQTVWRDLSSKYDVLGPYFTSESGMDAKYMIATIQESMLKLHWFGFHTVAIVLMVHASVNLSMIKLWSEDKTGAYGTQEGDDKHVVKPWFTDPFNGQKVFFIICPSHQVCSI